MDCTEPLFSILIANFNNGKFIPDAIESVVQQTYSNWEIVFVDDYSTDNSIEIAARYNGSGKLRIYQNNENKGVGFTKDKCIQLAQGELCGFLDPDDTLDPDALKHMVEVFNNNTNCSLVYSTHYLCDEKLHIIRIADYVGRLKRNDFLLLGPGERVISQFAVFEKRVYQYTGGVSINMKRALDHDLYYLLEEQGPVVYLDIPLYYYRLHSGNISKGGVNHYIAMFWDYEAKTRAFERRKSISHNLYLNNIMEYEEKYLYSSLVSNLFFRRSFNTIYKPLVVYMNIRNRNRSVLWVFSMLLKAVVLTCIKFPILKLYTRFHVKSNYPVLGIHN